jgi:hypothetical protein
MADEKLPLSRLIDAVTDELLAAQAAREVKRNLDGTPAIMQFEECELEMAVEIEISGEAKTNVWVFKLGGGIKKTDANTVKVKFSRLKDVNVAFPANREGEGPELGPGSARGKG